VINNVNNFLILYNHLRKGLELLVFIKKQNSLFRFNLTLNEEIMNMLTNKRKSSSITIIKDDESNNKEKKLKTNHTNIPNGDNKQAIVDCRQIPFQGINIKT